MPTITKEVREYKDIAFMMESHPLSGEIVTKKNAEAIKQSIRNLLLTRKGSRKFDPEFGSPIYEFLFENFTGAAIYACRTQIASMLGKYEPRFSVRKVDITSPSPNTINIEIEGLIVNTTRPITITLLVDRLR
jgi:phage baseplate assembly protein W